MRQADAHYLVTDTNVCTGMLHVFLRRQACYNVHLWYHWAQQDTKEAACSQFCSRVNLLNKDYLQLQHTDRRDVIHVFMSHQHQASGIHFWPPRYFIQHFLYIGNLVACILKWLILVWEYLIDIFSIRLLRSYYTDPGCPPWMTSDKKKQNYG